jgi:hypothetical protein
LKSKEKEIYSLENYKDNHQETIKTLKSDISGLKSENKKLLKERPVKTNKKFKSTSTNTLPMVPLINQSTSLNSQAISLNSQAISLNSQTTSRNSQTASLKSLTNKSKTATYMPFNNNSLSPNIAITSLLSTTASMDPYTSSNMACMVSTGMSTISLSKTTVDNISNATSTLNISKSSIELSQSTAARSLPPQRRLTPAPP